MARTPASSARIGATVQVGFVFRDEEGTLTTMTAVDFKAYRRGVLLESFAQDDARVELDATLSVALAADLGLTTAENTAGTGIVAVNYIAPRPGHTRCTPTGSPRWTTPPRCISWSSTRTTEPAFTLQREPTRSRSPSRG